MSQESLLIKSPLVDNDDKNKKAIVNHKNKKAIVNDKNKIEIVGDEDELDDVNKKAVPFPQNAKRITLKVATRVYARVKELSSVNYYIDAAFRSSRTDEVFIFCHHQYVVVTYDPTSPGKGRVVKGPLLLSDGFPNIYYTNHQTHGVDAAFGCHSLTEAYLFSGPHCAKIEYGPNVRMGNALGDPAGYTYHVFPCLEELGMTCSIDAAFESTVIGEAYLFKGSMYALLNYRYRTLIRTGLITDEFPCLLNTKFASDIRAAFASHVSNQAYLFKNDNSYVVIRYTPGKPNDSCIVWGPEEIVPSNWPALQGIVPFKKYPICPSYPKTWKVTPSFRGRLLHTADVVPPPRILI